MLGTSDTLLIREETLRHGHVSTDCAAQSTIFLSLPLVWEVVELDGF